MDLSLHENIIEQANSHKLEFNENNFSTAITKDENNDGKDKLMKSPLKRSRADTTATGCTKSNSQIDEE